MDFRHAGAQSMIVAFLKHIYSGDAAMSTRLPALLLSLSALITLCGCVKYDDSVEIDANGKGSAKIVMSRPEFGLIDKVRGRDIDNAFSETALTVDLPSDVKAVYARKEENNRVEVAVTYTFDDINKLIGWAAKQSTHPLRDLSVKRTGTELEFTRSFKANKEVLEDVRKFMPDTVLTFRLKGPGSITQHNGKLDGGVIVWEVKAVELFENGKDLKAAFFFGTPIWVYALIAFFVIDAIIIAIVLMKKKSSPPAVSSEPAKSA